MNRRFNASRYRRISSVELFHRYKCSPCGRQECLRRPRDVVPDSSASRPASDNCVRAEPDCSRSKLERHEWYCYTGSWGRHPKGTIIRLAVCRLLLTATVQVGSTFYWFGEDKVLNSALFHAVSCYTVSGIFPFDIGFEGQLFTAVNRSGSLDTAK